MKTIKTIIATTYPDVNNSVFTKKVLESFAKQINSNFLGLSVKDSKAVSIGKTIKAKVKADRKRGAITGYNLKVKMELDLNLISSKWEWFFIPDIDRANSIFMKKDIYSVITSAKLLGLKLVLMPLDVTLKPTVIDDGI
jgi:hypothetical protein